MSEILLGDLRSLFLEFGIVLEGIECLVNLNVIEKMLEELVVQEFVRSNGFLFSYLYNFNLVNLEEIILMFENVDLIDEDIDVLLQEVYNIN